MRIIIIIIIILLLLCTIYSIYCLNVLLIFHPTKIYYKKMNNIAEYFKEHFIEESVTTKDKIKLHCGLFNKIRVPSYNDYIFLYSHGNSGWLGSYMYDHMTTKLLSYYGSIFLYDYRGFGINKGSVSETGLYNDISAVWNFLVNDKHVPANKIILYGYSLGTAITTKLLHKIITHNKDKPKAIMLEAPFTKMKDLAKIYMPSISFLCMMNFNNMKNLSIKLDIPMCIIHSKDDEIIPYDHALKIQQKTNCDLITINGPHYGSVYSSDFVNWIEKNVK